MTKFQNFFRVFRAFRVPSATANSGRGGVQKTRKIFPRNFFGFFWAVRKDAQLTRKAFFMFQLPQDDHNHLLTYVPQDVLHSPCFPRAPSNGINTVRGSDSEFSRKNLSSLRDVRKLQRTRKTVFHIPNILFISIVLPHPHFPDLPSVASNDTNSGRGLGKCIGFLRVT